MVIEIIVGLFMGAITGMGIGGGGLLVLYLTELRGLSQLEAQGVNLLFFVASSVAALCIHNRRRRLPYRLIGISAASAVIGSFGGVSLAHILPEELVRHLFGWMLIITGTLAGAKQVISFIKSRIGKGSPAKTDSGE